MGSRIVRRLAGAGYSVVAWNRTQERAKDLDARVAATPAEAARAADVLITIISDPSALRAVVEGPAGIGVGADASLTVVDMSTVGPAAVSWLAGALPPETGVLDAPVLGSLSEAESGSLAIFVGGPADLVERWTPVLSALGTPIHVGPLGSGAAAKLVANTTLFGILALLGETIALGDALGLERTALYEVLSKTPLAAQADRRREAIETGDVQARFSLGLARKDANLISEAAAEAGLELPLAAAARDWLVDAETAGWGDRDYSTVLAWILKAARVPSEPSL